MKLGTFLRMQMMMVGLGAALFLTSSVYAQQEVDPATFDDGVNVAPVPQPVPANFVASTSQAQETSGDVQLAILPTPSPFQVEGDTAWTPIDMLALCTLLTCAGCILLYEFDQARRIAQAVSANGSLATP
jgi:hypothetical protein